ncbi:MAG: transcriptional repressor [Deltaproteobacteria bacterium]|nr:transcriptional repressor [Deltaproteobacteria bacterium]
MKPSQQQLDKMLQHCKEAFNKAGVKLTPQRFEVFREVALSRKHPDAAMVHNGVRQRMPSLSLDTVYRTLWLLSDLGLFTTISPSRDCTRFDANPARHHHFICNKCSLICDFCNNEFNNLKIPKHVKSLGEILTTNVEIRGICRGCLTNKRRNHA